MPYQFVGDRNTLHYRRSGHCCAWPLHGMATYSKCFIYERVYFLAGNIKYAEVDSCRVRQRKVDTCRGVKGVGIVLSEREVWSGFFIVVYARGG